MNSSSKHLQHLSQKGWIRQNITHYQNPWRTASIVGFVGILSLLMLMSSTLFGVMSSCVFLGAMFIEYTQQRLSWISQLGRKKSGVNYILTDNWKLLSAQHAVTIHFFAHNHFVSPSHLWQNMFRSPLRLGSILLILLTMFGILLGQIYFSLLLLGLSCLLFVLLFFLSPPKIESHPQITTIEKREKPDSHIFVLFDQGIFSEAQDIFLLNYRSYLQVETITIHCTINARPSIQKLQQYYPNTKFCIIDTEP